MTETAKVLIIEDEAPIRRFLRAGLSEPEFHVVEAASLQEGLKHAATQNPDIILLDLGLPDGDGVDFIPQLRGWSDTPIVILSARGLESEKVRALDLGANDYVTKPFGMAELLARVRAALRTNRAGKGRTEPLIEAGDLEIDLAAREVRKENAIIHLTPIEYKLLVTLAENAGKVLTHRQLLTTVWGEAYARQTQYLRVFMGQLRRKIENDPARPQHLITESGVGYRFRI